MLTFFRPSLRGPALLKHQGTMSTISAPPSPVAVAFPNIQWDALGSLRLTAQETALLRMAETNPIHYTLADSRDASMYARVLLKVLAEAFAAGAGKGASDWPVRKGFVFVWLLISLCICRSALSTNR